MTQSSNIDFYLAVATRKSTRRSYEAAVWHFEVEWGSFLPASLEAIAKNLANYAGDLAIRTLTQRFPALAQWHFEQGFADPTKSPLVRKVMRGIRAEHPVQGKQAKPLQSDQLS